MDHMHESLSLPIAGEASASLCQAIAGGQPVVLVRDGRPAAVVIDVDSWPELDDLIAAAEPLGAA